MSDSDRAAWLEPDGVWAVMARRLLDADGPRIPARSMKAEIEKGVATITWIEQHQISEAEYDALVVSARSQQEN